MQIIPSKTGAFGFLSSEYVPMAHHIGKSAGAFAAMLTSNASGSGNQSGTSQGSSQTSGQTASQLAGQIAGVVSAAQAALSAPSMPQSQADTSLRNVKMTQQDFAALQATLAQAGVPQDTITKLSNDIQSPQGLTWGQFMQNLQQTTLQQFLKPTDISDADKSNVSSLLSSLGFDPKQAGDLTTALANGKPARVFDLISSKLKGLDPSDTVTVTQDQVASLAKALKLPDSATQSLLSQFGGQDSMELSSTGLSQMFTAAKSDLSQVLSQAGDAMKTIKELVDPAMDLASQRLSMTQQQANSQVQSMQLKPSSLLQGPQDAATSTNNAGNKNQAGPAYDDHSTNKNQANTAHDDHSTNDDFPGFQKDGHQQTSQLPGKDGVLDGKSTSQDNKSATDRAWEELADKLQTQGESLLSSGTGQSNGQTTAGQTILGQTTAQGLTQALSQAVTPEAQAAKTQATPFLDQVQAGILKNMGQGVSQLTLELTPESLGKLNVMLTVKGQDVQAVIKADSPEAEKALSDNLQQIKQSLEDQGLTVSKLEVRAGLQQDANLGQQWAGTDKHNQSQERREALERMRTSSMLAGGDSVAMAQQMQSVGVEANISQTGLDIVA
jgi:flagellar hook-length control protein FliK